MEEEDGLAVGVVGEEGASVSDSQSLDGELGLLFEGLSLDGVPLDGLPFDG